MPFLNVLGDREFKIAERLSAWTLTLLGYCVAGGMASDSSGWNDPVFRVVSKIPWTPYSWAVALVVATFVFNIGYTRHPESHWRGRLIIWGALLCAIWWLALTICTSRVVYETPTRVTILWPLIALGVACMYLTRVIAYSDMFTGDRWSTNPHQTWGTTFLMLASLSQVIIGIAPVSVLTEIEKGAALSVGAANLFGAAITMWGLHLKDKEQGLLYELAGSVSLILSLGMYCVLVLHRQPLAGSSLGFALPEAFVFATLQRGIQVMGLQWARWHGRGSLEHRMIHALNPTAHRPRLESEVDPPHEVHDDPSSEMQDEPSVQDEEVNGA